MTSFTEAEAGWKEDSMRQAATINRLATLEAARQRIVKP